VRPLRPAAAGLVLVVLAAGCAGSGTGAPAPLTADQRQRMDAIVSVFENGTTEIQYGYAEELGDGRGITAGRAGFTSATGDLLAVVERYVDEEPGSPLGGYLPALEQLAAAESGDTSRIAGFASAWAAAAEDPAMRAAQDAEVDRTYFRPAQGVAEELDLEQPISLAVLYDTIIQHGEGDDPDGLPAIVAETLAVAGGSPGTGVDEEEWTSQLLDIRRAHLADAADPATREEWAASVGRVDSLQALVDAGVDLRGPFTMQAFGDEYRIP
jgi:chitosanase